MGRRGTRGVEKGEHTTPSCPTPTSPAARARQVFDQPFYAILFHLDWGVGGYIRSDECARYEFEQSWWAFNQMEGENR